MSEYLDNSFDDPDSQPPNLVGHYAGFASRAIALVIDYLIILLLLFIMVWFINSIPNLLNLQVINLNWLNSTVIFVSSTAFTLIIIYTYFNFFWFLTGQTLGNAVMGIRVVRTNGRRVGFLRGLVRSIGYLLAFIPLGLGFLWVLGDDRRQGWHDKLAGTYVIYAWEARPNERFLSQSFQSHLPTRLAKYLRLPPQIQSNRTEPVPSSGIQSSKPIR